MNLFLFSRVSVSILAGLMIMNQVSCSNTEDVDPAESKASSAAAAPSKKEDRKSMCEALERYMEDAMKIYYQSSRSVRTTRAQELDKFLRLKKKFEQSAEFIDLPEHLRDYVLMHDEAWQRCRSRDEASGCSQADGLRQTISAMCKQWQSERY